MDGRMDVAMYVRTHVRMCEPIIVFNEGVASPPDKGGRSEFLDPVVLTTL